MFLLWIAAITLLPTSTRAIKCLPLDFNMELSFDSINSPEFNKTLTALVPSYREDYCELHTVFEYRQRMIQIRSINNSAESHPMSKSMIWFYINMFYKKTPGQLKTITTEHHVTTRCDTGDWCDLHLFLYHVHWFMRLNYTGLMEDMLILFVRQQQSSGVCETIPHPAVDCPSGICYLESQDGYDSVGCSINSNKTAGIEANLTYLIFEYPQPMDPKIAEMYTKYPAQPISISTSYFCPWQNFNDELTPEQTAKALFFFSDMYHKYAFYMMTLPSILETIDPSMLNVGRPFRSMAFNSNTARTSDVAKSVKQSS